MLAAAMSLGSKRHPFTNTKISGAQGDGNVLAEPGVRHTFWQRCDTAALVPLIVVELGEFGERLTMLVTIFVSQPDLSESDLTSC